MVWTGKQVVVVGALLSLSACSNGEPLSLAGAIDAASHTSTGSFPVGRRTVELRRNLSGRYSLDVIGTTTSVPVESTAPVIEEVIDNEATNSRVAVIRGPTFNCQTKYQFVDFVHNGNYHVSTSPVPGCEPYRISRYNDSSILLSDSSNAPEILYQQGKFRRIVPDSRGTEAQNRAVGIIPVHRQASPHYGHLSEVQTSAPARVSAGGVIDTGSSTVSLD